MRGAGGSHEDPPFPQPFHTRGKKLAVGCYGTFTLNLFLCQRRRIYDNEVIDLLPLLFQPLESIRTNIMTYTMLHSRDSGVQLKIPAGALQRMSANIQIRHRFRPARGGTDRKRPGKTENVQDIAPARQLPDYRPIISLIEKETRFLPAHQVSLKTETIFLKNHRPIRTYPVDGLPILESRFLPEGVCRIPAQP